MFALFNTYFPILKDLEDALKMIFPFTTLNTLSFAW